MSAAATSRPFGKRAWPALAAVATLLAVGCGTSTPTPSGSGTNPTGGNTPQAGADITLASSASLGSYLVAGGKTLYYFGLDTPGTAAQGAVSNCTSAGDCLGIWPIYDVTSPTLGTGLQAADFGEFTRSDGAKQATFQGWPLYFYAGDAAAGDTSGDNFEAWYVLREPFYSLLVRTKSPTGATLFLADPAGRTVYSFTEDTVGTASTPPVSACTGSCLTTWTLFVANGTVTPTGVDATKLTTLTRPDGNMQSAFDGHPLYYFANDTLPGETNGDGFMGLWNVVSPAATN